MFPPLVQPGSHDRFPTSGCVPQPDTSPTGETPVTGPVETLVEPGSHNRFPWRLGHCVQFLFPPTTEETWTGAVLGPYSAHLFPLILPWYLFLLQPLLVSWSFPPMSPVGDSASPGIGVLIQKRTWDTRQVAHLLSSLGSPLPWPGWATSPAVQGASVVGISLK